MKTLDLIQEVYFNCDPDRLYEILMTSELHGIVTQSEVEISPEMNTEFKVYSGYISGKNILLEPGKLILQEWRAEEEHWPDYHYSTVQFKIESLDRGTHLTFIHKGIPESCFEAISNGWEEYYWHPIKNFIEINPIVT
ncbi:MAG: SRPBCC domain-containing protein [Flavobacteriales bacterium]|nr:SRPBCC domain-containing protein [Flavobacteriales bacterium]